MRVIVIGSQGQLGTALCEVFADTDLVRADILGADVELDVSSRDSLCEIICGLHPDLVINTAAAHDVNRCEDDPAWAFAINATGASNAALACTACGARLIHISTDYVFGETREGVPLLETDMPTPLNVYGASKLAGEYLVAADCDNHCTVRTAGLYGLAPCLGKSGVNFVIRMLQQAEQELRVVNDEFTTPTCTAPLAQQIRLIAERGEPGLYHATCQGGCSWFEFAQAIFEESGQAATLSPVTRDAFPSPVKRPSYSVLENGHLQAQGLDIMPPWRDALCAYLAELPRSGEAS